ncbi:unnamed protein product (macronuclear) [Paramecium tetraurelia]|uniref:Ion transport domain-containing protein n=1 Tax=Paramecium tetraurelia TaxID=5888 RepID=A0BZH2_PARTE|nr:uncharacterized protein GSPATT00033792001 [Paramecium tetraurelia]CAK63939.1 unnamed protein product [Paramecium tetraurelia]|eukprot:XP_001431337.1 hypothetical protein (macronuclear) [Paramecium tetraurelia strain d4-2]
MLQSFLNCFKKQPKFRMNRDYEKDILSSVQDILPQSFQKHQYNKQNMNQIESHNKEFQATNDLNRLNQEQGIFSPNPSQANIRLHFLENVDEQFQKNENPYYCQFSLDYFGMNNKFRQYCILINESRVYQYSVYIFTTFCIVILMIKPYNGQKSGFGFSLNDDQILGVIVTADVIFAAHHLISIVSYGYLEQLCRLWSCKYGYYRNPIAFINGIALFFALILRQSYFYTLRILFLLEFFMHYKILRIVRKFCLTVEHSFISIVYITIIICFFFYVFAVVGLQIWTGIIGNQCINKDNEVDYYPTRFCGLGRSCSDGYECQQAQFEQPFIQYSHNFTKFDYIQESMASLFIVHYIEGWVEIEQSLADSFNKYVSTGYLWTYIFICSFFLQNLVVAIFLKQSQQEVHLDEPAQTVLFLNSHTKISLTNEKRKTVFQSPNYLSRSKQRVMTMLMNSTKRSSDQRKIRVIIKSILSSKITQYFYSLLFLANLVVLSLNDESAYINKLEGTLAKINVVFLVIYLIEDIARIYIWKQKESKIIVLLEFICDFVGLIVQVNQLEHPFILNTIKGIRLLWVFNYQTSWSNYRVLLSALWKSFNNIPIMILILFIYGLVIGLMGRNFFAGKLRFNDLGFYDLDGSYIPRANFDSMRETITTLFIIISSDQWQTIFYTTLETGSWIPYIFFICVQFICKFFILPSFLTLMLDNYEDAKNEADISKARATKIISTMQNKSRIVPTKETSLLQVSNSQSEKKRFFGRLSKVSDDSEKEETHSKQHPALKRQQSKYQQVQIFKSSDDFQIISLYQQNWKEFFGNSSLFILHNRSNLRKKLHILIQSKYYDWAMSFIILSNLILLGYDQPLRKENLVIDVFNYAFTGIFILDAFIKILAQGFYWNKQEPQKSYIMNNNNQLDFVVLIISSLDDLNIYKSQYLRAFRALRTLRILITLRRGSQNEQLNLISRSLLQTISLLSSMIFVTGISLWILSIICMTIWKGKLYFCSQVSLKDFQDIVNVEDCLAKGGQWINNITNYDTIQDSLLCLFRLIIGEGWTQQMFSVSDITNRGLNPKINSSSQYQFFFYVLIFSLNIVLLNLITGLIINNYRTIKENIANFQQLNEFQRQWIQMMQIMQKKKLIYLIPKPSSKYRLICYHLASNQYFETVILILLVVNLILQLLHSYLQSITTQEALYGMSIFFIVIFHVELFIKLLAYWVHFFRDILNKFDIIILIVTDVLLIMKDSFDLPRLYTIPLIIRSLRIIKANKLFRFNKQLRVLIDVIQDLIPTLLSVIVFIAITIIIYSLIGVQTFSTVWSTSSDPHQRTKSFSNFLDGVLILIDISTGQYWSLYMADYTIDTKGCHAQTPEQFESEGARGCSTIFGYFFFISFLVLIRIIMTSLFLAMIIESYQECQLENTAAINPYQLEDFLVKWSDYDPQGTGWITPEDFAFLMFEINPPLGFKDENSQYYDFAAAKNQKLKSHFYNHKKKMRLFKTEIFQKLSDYQVQIYQNKMVHFKDICIQLAYNAIKKKNELKGIEQIEDKIILRQIRKSWESRYPDLVGMKTQQFVVDIFAFNSITDILRGVIERRKIKKRIKEMQKEKNLKQLEINENAYITTKTLLERNKGRRRSQIRKKVYNFQQTNVQRRSEINVDIEQAIHQPKRAMHQNYQKQQQNKDDKNSLTSLNFYIDPDEMCNGFPMKVVHETQKIDFPAIKSDKSLGTLQATQSEKQVKKLGGYISEKCSDEENQQDSVIQNFKRDDMFE